MQIEITTPALLFPTISLFMLAYTNRFSALVNRIRELSGKHHADKSEIILKQILFLEKRVQLIVLMQAFLVIGMLLCIISMFLLMFYFYNAGKVIFILSLLFLCVSLSCSFFEILISSQAIKIQLSNMKNIT